jgi:3-hydroxyisobutyrate dehydrogenase-like beta-hydroxyacid dehydrogenase
VAQCEPQPQVHCSALLTPTPLHGNALLTPTLLHCTGATCIDSSTIDLVTVKEMARIATEEHGAGFLDAPVSGGVGGAEVKNAE